MSKFDDEFVNTTPLDSMRLRKVKNALNDEEIVWRGILASSIWDTPDMYWEEWSGGNEETKVMTDLYKFCFECDRSLREEFGCSGGESWENLAAYHRFIQIVKQKLDKGEL